MNEKIYDMLIVGGGPGGYTAALYAARAGMSVAVLEKLSAGGQMAESPQIDNYPGLIDGIDGFSLGMQMQAHAEKFGAETHSTEVTGLHLSDKIKIAETVTDARPLIILDSFSDIISFKNNVIIIILPKVATDAADDRA